MRELTGITKALADENRLRVLRALGRGELCVCQITELLGLATPTVSRHLSVLANAGLIDHRKEGRWVYYRLPAAPSPAVARALAWLTEMFADLPPDPVDAERLCTIKATDREELCRQQRRN